MLNGSRLPLPLANPSPPSPFKPAPAHLLACQYPFGRGRQQARHPPLRPTERSPTPPLPMGPSSLNFSTRAST